MSNAAQPIPVENDEATVAALKEATGAEAVRTRLGVDPESGEERHAPGYRKIPNLFTGAEGKAAHGYQFVNERGQVVQVPGHRIDPATPAEEKSAGKPDGKPKGA